MFNISATYDTLEAAREAVGKAHAHIICTCGVTLENCRCWSADKLTIAVNNGCGNCK